MNTESRQSVLRGFKECLTSNPLPVLSLLIYMGLRSNTIFAVPDTAYVTEQPLWAPAYTGWYDLALIVSVCFGIATKSITLTKHILAVLFSLLVIILISSLGAYSLGFGFISDAIAYFLRFSVTFIFAASLARRSGIEAVEALVLVLFAVLGVTALFVFSLNFGMFNRIYASAMTAASFGQIAAVSCFLAIFRRRPVVLLISSTYLLLTFSRTSMIMLLGLLVIYLFHDQELRFRTKLKYLVALAVCAVAGALAVTMYGGPEFDVVVASRISSDEISTLNGRLQIWEGALGLLRESYIPITGVGLNAAPSLLLSDGFAIDQGQGSLPVHFHSILIEYGFGFGLLSIPIFYGLGRRLVQTFRSRCYPSFFIFAFFCLSQAFDFTFYQPKEVIIWSLLLGLAEAQWQLDSSSVADRDWSPQSATRMVRVPRA